MKNYGEIQPGFNTNADVICKVFGIPQEKIADIALNGSTPGLFGGDGYDGFCSEEICSCKLGEPCNQERKLECLKFWLSLSTRMSTVLFIEEEHLRKKELELVEEE